MRLFNCTRHEGGLRVTKAFCGQSWRRAQGVLDPIDRVRLGPCVDCATGKRNGSTGEPVAAKRRQAMWGIK